VDEVLSGRTRTFGSGHLMGKTALHRCTGLDVKLFTLLHFLGLAPKGAKPQKINHTTGSGQPSGGSLYHQRDD
jgi:hypothetical protein